MKEKLLNLGLPFPSIETQTTHGMIVLLDHLAGKWIILFNFPA